MKALPIELNTRIVNELKTWSSQSKLANKMCWQIAIENKPGTAQVGAISKAQK